MFIKGIVLPVGNRNAPPEEGSFQVQQKVRGKVGRTLSPLKDHRNSRNSCCDVSFACRKMLEDEKDKIKTKN